MINKILSNNSNPRNSLSEEEEAFLKVTDNHLEDNFIGAHIFDNHKVSSNIENPIAGATLAFKASAPAHPNLFNNEFAGQIICSEIQDDPNINEEYFIQNKNALLNIPEYSEQGIGLDILHPKECYDNRPWVPTLGKNGCVSVKMIRGQQGRNKFYLVVQSDAGRAGDDLKAFLKTRKYPNYTMHDFKNSRQYYKTVDLSRRNSRRVMLKAADLLGIKLTCGISDDLNAVVENPAIVSPKLAVPHVSNEYNVMTSNPSGKQINYYSYTCPIKNAVNGLFHVADNTLEMNLYNAKQGYNTNIDNEYESTFSPFTAVKKEDQITPTDGHYKNFINQRMVWDSKNASNPSHPKLDQRYEAITAQDRTQNQDVFGAKYGHEHLHPVISRLALY